MLLLLLLLLLHLLLLKSYNLLVNVRRVLANLLQRGILFGGRGCLLEASDELLQVFVCGARLGLTARRCLLLLLRRRWWSVRLLLLLLLLRLIGVGLSVEGDLAGVGEAGRGRGSVGEGRADVEGRVDAVGEHRVLELRVGIGRILGLGLPVGGDGVGRVLAAEQGVGRACGRWVRAHLGYVALGYLGDDARLLLEADAACRICRRRRLLLLLLLLLLLQNLLTVDDCLLLADGLIRVDVVLLDIGELAFAFMKLKHKLEKLMKYRKSLQCRGLDPLIIVNYR